MLRLFYDDDHNSMKLLFQILKKNPQQKTIIFVPEAYSFYTEKTIYYQFKNSNFKVNLKIFTFKNFCLEIFKNYGHIAHDFALFQQKIIALNLAISKLKNQINLNKNLIYNLPFTEKILNTIEKLKKNNISIEKLQKITSKIKNNELKIRLEELTKIFISYEKILKKNYKDPNENIKIACKILSKNNILQKIKIFFLFFFDFDISQLKLIETIAKQTDITFFINYNKHQFVFNTTKNVINKLKQIADKNKIKILQQKSTLNAFVKPKNLHFLQKNIFSKHKINKLKKFKSENLKIYLTDDKEMEVLSALSKVIELKQKGLKWDDIAILSKNIKSYESMLKINLKNYNIPYYFDQNNSAKDLNLIKLIINIIELSSNFNLDLYLNILNSNLTNFNFEETSKFSYYINKFNLENTILNRNFKNIINQLSNKLSSKIIIKIIKMQHPINVITSCFKNNLYCCEDISFKLIKIITILGIKNKIKTATLVEEWNIFIEILETIFKFTKKNKISIKQFKFLFTCASLKFKIKKIPQYSKCVFIGNLEKTIPNDIKALIIVGCDSNFFSANGSQSNYFFTFKEIDKLKNTKLAFFESLQDKNETELFLTFKILASATKYLLIFCYNENIHQDLEKINNSLYEITKLFDYGIVEKLDKKNYLSCCKTKKIAIKQLLKHYDENSNTVFLLKKYFNKKLSKYKKISKNNEVKINTESFFNYFISPSHIEQFYTCPFSYYCKYILKIEPISKINFNNIFLGKVIHKILEKIVSLENFLNLDKKQIKKDITEILNCYINTNYSLQKSECLKYVKNSFNLVDDLLELCEYIQSELKIIHFEPKAFEYPISFNSKLKPIKIKTSDNKYINIIGRIDRIDIKTHENIKFLRIIDYKFKNVSLNFSEFFQGLNLQPIIYLLIVKENIKQIKNLNLLGIFYMPTIGNLRKYNNFKKPPSEKDIENIIKKIFLPNILFLDSPNNEKILQIFKSFEYKNFNPIKITNDNNIHKSSKDKMFISDEEINFLYDFVEKKVLFLYENIKKLNFPKNINLSLNTTTKECINCVYNEICNNQEKLINYTKQKNLNKEEFFNLL